jgi:hypothetical protein
VTSPWVRRWEDLSPGRQALVVLPVAVVAMLLLHLGPLNQPTGRAITYALFWGAVITVALVVASRSERARRLERERRDPRRESDDSD